MKPGTRDNDGHSQGTIIIDILEAVSTNDQGHWVTAKVVGASDAYMRWWMSEGEGKRLTSKCTYHFFADSSHDCEVTRRGASIHVEKFRVLTLGLQERHEQVLHGVLGEEGHAAGDKGR